MKALPQEYLLPFGAVTFLVVANALIMLYVRWQWTRDHAVVLLAALIAGLAGDWRLTRSGGSSPLVMLRRFAFVAPFLPIFSLFVILQLSATIWWNTHLWPGVSLLAGAPGLVLGVLLTQGELPAAECEATPAGLRGGRTRSVYCGRVATAARKR
ncbi:MAG: hypothetical protein OXB89_08015 [Anaerolineaceae bacterium]|nr:hypothetical protein [Anaerolineaceae bacterium]